MGKGSPKDRRLYPRVDLSAYVFLSTTNGGCEGTLVNLSRGGALVASKQDIARVGDATELFLPSANEQMVGILGETRRIRRDAGGSFVALAFPSTLGIHRPDVHELFDLLLGQEAPATGMQAIDGTLLEPRATAVVLGIESDVLRATLIRALTTCERAFRGLDDLHLTRNEEIDLGLKDLSLWNEAAPALRRTMAIVQECLDRVSLLEPPKDVELNELERAKLEELRRAIAVLVKILVEEVKRFGARLRVPQVVAVRWNLLAELQEFRGKCAQCFEAIALSLLGGFCSEAPDELLCRYGRATRKGIRLRQSVFDLAYEIAGIKRNLEETPGVDIKAISQRLHRRIDEFCMSQAYLLMRAGDKREVNGMRMFLIRWKLEDPRARQALIRKLGGFCSFLMALRSINRRLEICDHDRRHLRQVISALAEGTKETELLLDLEPLFGMDETLDRWILAKRLGMHPATELDAVLQECLLAAERKSSG